ncbi:hypothetical protein AGMMS50276_17870 [Synergistales bacterium]|nr:hypothetical protein AGMMS50276_17870 [Synergistales bacterium]
MRKFLILLTIAIIFRADISLANTELLKAEALMERGHTQEAYKLLFRLLREDPGNDEIDLALARAASSHHPHQAVMAYERLIVKYPRQAIFRREIASVYMSVNDPKSAERHLRFDHTLDENARVLFLKDLEKRFDPFQRHWTLRAGTFYDSNANQGLDSNSISLGDYFLTLDSAKKIHTGGLYFGGNINTSYKLSSPWQFVTDGAFYLRYGASDELKDVGQEYSQWWRGALGFRRTGETDMLDFRVKGEVFDYDFHETVYSYGGELTFSHAVDRHMFFITRASIEKRDYVRNHAYDGVYASIGEYLWLSFGNKHEFNIGARLLFADADYDHYDYNGYEASAWFRFRLQNEIEVSPSVSYTKENYDGPATILEYNDREDKRLRLGLSAKKRINENLSLEISYNYTDNNSNSNIHDYNRHVVNLGCAWSF